MSADSLGLPPGCEVLMVEDDVGLRNRMSGRLRAMGATVTEVGRLAETRKLLRELRFDFALVDLHLPDGDLHCITPLSLPRS